MDSAESSEVKAFVGWAAVPGQVRQGGEQLTGRSESANRETPESQVHMKRIQVENRECRARIRHWTKAIPAGEELGVGSQRTLRGLGGRHAEKERQRKLGTTHRWPRPAGAGTARAPHITRRAGKLRRVGEWDGWGRLSVDGPGHYNPDRSDGPWGRAAKPLERRCRNAPTNLDTERGPHEPPRFEVVACIAGRGFKVRREDMKKLLLSTRGKVFTLQNMQRLVDCTELATFRTRESLS